nr:MAG TPA: hypothetical protein [Bacteriophage sp.]
MYLYEVSIYKITKKTAYLLSTRFYKSNKILNVEQCTIKKYNKFSIIRFINYERTH